MTGCNPELSFHTQKINTEVLECSHTHVSARSTSTQDVNENDMLTLWVTAVASHMRLWCLLLVECHGCFSLSCGRVFVVTDSIPCCCSLVECLIIALLIMHCHWWHYRCPLVWILTHPSLYVSSYCLWIDTNNMVSKISSRWQRVLIIESLIHSFINSNLFKNSFIYSGTKLLCIVLRSTTVLLCLFWKPFV